MSKKCLYSKTGKLNERQKLKNRAKAIRKEYMSLPTYSGIISSDDDRYQEALEVQWLKRDLMAEFKTINEELGYPDKQMR